MPRLVLSDSLADIQRGLQCVFRRRGSPLSPGFFVIAPAQYSYLRLTLCNSVSS